MTRLARTLALPMFLITTAVLLGGCPIPQQPGAEDPILRTCRTTGRGYWLYIPENYNHERTYPMVLTLHGMKPYDVAEHHVKMWGKLADEHGFVICAPKLQTSDSFGQFPLRNMGPAEVRDVECTLAAMEEVIEDWKIDRNSILLSSWSMGGYLSHYLLTEYGEKFAAFAPLQSNFSDTILDSGRARRFAGKVPIFVFYGSVDFRGVTEESRESIDYYRKLGYDVTVKEAPIGHERHPELAAQFFERVLARQQKNIDILVTPPGGTEPPPLAVNLWPQLSSKIGEVRSYQWNFGRLGRPSYQKSPNVLIRQPGTYPVSLTVTDSHGRRYSASTMISVPQPAAARGNRTYNRPQPR